MNESGLESEHQAVGHKEDLGPSPWKYGYRKYPLPTSPVSESDLCLYYSGPVVKPNSTMESELGHWTLLDLQHKLSAGHLHQLPGTPLNLTPFQFQFLLDLCLGTQRSSLES